MCVGTTSFENRSLRKRSLHFAATLVAGVMISLCVPAAYGQEAQPEFVVKTAFIYNFLKFTQWPNGAIARSDSPIVVCTMGADPYGTALNVLASKHIDSHPVTLERSVSASALSRCNAVVISGPTAAQTLADIAPFRTHPVLTIGDAADFAEAGGMIGLVNVDQQVRFQINVSAVHRSGLSVSSQLLKIAILVDEPR